MSDAAAPRPPSEPTENAVSASVLPPASSSDSAPPLAASHPAPVPPRNYSQGPVYLAAPPAYAPNSSVPTFLRTLAALVFVGGSISAAVAWVYKTIIYPRLVVALKARSRLFSIHEAAYSKLFDALKAFTGSTGVARLGGADALEFRRKKREELAERAEEGGAPSDTQEKQEGEKQPLLEKDEAAAGPEADPAQAPEPTLPPTPQVLAPLRSSLSTLNTELKAASAPSASSSSSPHAGGLTNPSNLVQPQGMLMRSLVTLNEYLESETYAASTFHTYRPYGAYGASSGGPTTATGERKALQEVTHNFKADIRSLKGALLNRRNFVRPEVSTSA
ncbi:Peroxin Pex14/17-penicillium chrysogenum [Rhodotorula diobovata]|uniref:Peroxin Pex14/17-penicillium chrysogenum n=1 Tax=Rhodotorula diobovata TaxID=5288 RepID=A0A5C5G6U6_9BASI|nr:Peroxin Pex14/17-penicillium chrysogenum [Rhodotorula diobovata]